MWTEHSTASKCAEVKAEQDPVLESPGALTTSQGSWSPQTPRFGWRLYVRLFCRLKRYLALTGINLLLNVGVCIKAQTKFALNKYMCTVNIAKMSPAYVTFYSEVLEE